MIDRSTDGQIIPHNLAGDVIESANRYVSTAIVGCSAIVTPQLAQYETFIWTWDNGKRRKILHMIFHDCEHTALKIHRYIVSNLRSTDATAAHGRANKLTEKP